MEELTAAEVQTLTDAIAILQQKWSSPAHTWTLKVGEPRYDASLFTPYRPVGVNTCAHAFNMLVDVKH